MAAEDMSPTEQMNDKVVQLLSGIAEHGDLHLAEVEGDLVQVDVLLTEAIKKLCASFMAIHQAVDQQQAAVSSVLASGAHSPEKLAQLEKLRGEIEQHVGAAITGLQFQDMTSQLIGRMAKHLGGLREVFGALDLSESIMPEAGSDSALTLLDTISDQVTSRFAKLDGVVRSTVNQRHMDSGDIELF
jgi:hypothetical protein